jgi:hypothetical protein
VYPQRPNGRYRSKYDSSTGYCWSLSTELFWSRGTFLP